MHSNRATLSPGILGLCLALAIPALGGCDFFKELESLPGAEDDTGDDEGADEADDDTGDSEPCTTLDDSCADQDTLLYCDEDSGELVSFDCGATCLGIGMLNFSCVPAESSHSCWCVSPGEYKLKTCTELESCISACGDPASDCSAACFEDTTAQTVRLLGSLYSCADLFCDETCKTSPADCGTCINAALSGLWGDCGVQRSVCDADESDEPSWP